MRACHNKKKEKNNGNVLQLFGHVFNKRIRIRKDTKKGLEVVQVSATVSHRHLK